MRRRIAVGFLQGQFVDHDRDNPILRCFNNVQQLVVELRPNFGIAKPFECPARVDHVFPMQHNRIVGMVWQILCLQGFEFAVKPQVVGVLKPTAQQTKKLMRWLGQVATKDMVPRLVEIEPVTISKADGLAGVALVGGVGSDIL